LIMDGILHPHTDAVFETLPTSGKWHRRATGHRCQTIGSTGPLHKHHECNGDPVAVRPDWMLTAVCNLCHDRWLRRVRRPIATAG